MDECVLGFGENILERLDNRHAFNEDEIDFLINSIDLKLEAVNAEAALLQDRLEVEETSLQHNDCELDPLATYCFLNNVVQAIERNPGKEDHVLKNLVNFCRNNCIALSMNSSAHVSRQSLNSLDSDNSTEETVFLWMKLQNTLRAAIINILKNLPDCEPNSPQRLKYAIADQRLSLFQLLTCILSLSDAIKYYCKYRESIVAGSDAIMPTNDKSQLVDWIKAGVIIRYELLKEDAELFYAMPECSDESDICPLSELYEMYSSKLLEAVNQFAELYKDEPSQFATVDVKLFAALHKNLMQWSTYRKTILQEGTHSVYTQPTVHEDWESTLKEFHSDITTAMSSLCHCLPKSILLDAGKNASKVYISQELLVNNVDQLPLTLSFKCGKLASFIREMSVFTKLPEIKESIVRSIVEVLQSYHLFLKETLEHFGQYHNKMELIYSALCDSIYIKHLVQTLEPKQLDDNRRGCYTGVIQNYETLIELCAQHIVEYHITTLKSSLVYDLHSNNWTDERKFFEGERCSFPVEMFGFYMSCLVHDMRVLPRPLRARVIRAVTEEMLVFFNARYMRVTPSYQRTIQVKADLLYLLATFYWLSTVYNESENDVIGNENNHINTLTSNLLHIMMVLSAPLSIIESLAAQDVQSIDSYLNWKDVALPYVENEEIKVILDLFTNSTRSNYDLLLKFLLRNDVELSNLLLLYNEYLCEPVSTYKESDLGTSFETFCETSVLPVSKSRLMQAFYTVFLNVSQNAFIKFILNLVKDDYSKSFKTSHITELPSWLQLFATNLSSIFERILLPTCELLKYQYKDNPTFNFINLQKLPCGCEAVHVPDQNIIADPSELLHKCLVMTLESLVDNIVVLPNALWIVLLQIKESTEFCASWIQQQNLGTKVLASLLYHWLTSLDLPKLFPRCHVNEAMETDFKNFAELLWHVIYGLTHEVAENPKISMAIHKYLQQSKDKITTLLSALDRHCNLTKTDVTIKADDALAFNLSEKSMESLAYINSVVCFNKQAVKVIISNKASFEALHGCKNALEGGCEMVFNPLSHYKQLNGETYQFQPDFQMDWEKLLPLVPRAKFKALVTNRFEFQPAFDSMLLEEEKQSVKNIKQKLQITE